MSLDAAWVIVDNAEHANGETGRLIATRHAVQQELIRSDRRAELWEDHFPAARIPELRNTVRELSRWWHTGTGLTDALHFEGVDLSQLMEYALSSVVAGLVHEIAIIEALWAEAPPEKIVVSRSSEPLRTLLDDVCRRRAVPLKSMGNPTHEAATPALRKGGFLAGVSAFRRTVHRLWSFRKRNKPFQILSSRGRYTGPLSEANRDRMAFYFYSGRNTSECIRFARLLSPSIRRSVRRADAVRMELRGLYAEIGDFRLDCEGYNLWPLVKPYLNRFFGVETSMDEYCGSPFAEKSRLDLNTVLDHLVYAGYLMENCRPHAVVVLQDAWGLPLAMVAAAQARGIPSAVMQHGIPGQYSPVAADEGFMWGEYGQRFFLNRDPKMEGRVHVTGNPVPSSRIVHVPAGPLRDRFSIPADSRLITFIGQPYVGLTASDSPTFWERHVRGIFSAVSTMEKTFLLVRPHPSEQEATYEEAARSVGARHFAVDRGEDLISCLNAADLVVIYNSTVSIDAMLLKKRLLVFDVSWDESGIPFQELGGVQRVSHIEELASGLEAALASEPDLEAYQRFIDDQIQCSGTAAARSAGDALIRLIERGGLSQDPAHLLSRKDP